MTYHPAILDGPWKGMPYETDNTGFFIARVPRTVPGEFLFRFIGDTLTPFVPELAFDEYRYYIHKMKFGKYCILTASVNPAQPSLEDAAELLLTDYAKKTIV